MNRTTFINFKVLLLSITLLSSIQSTAQKVITDTFTYYSYGEYCEGISFCEYLVPDSTYLRLDGRAPDETKEFSYPSFCHSLGYDGTGTLHGYKDFELIIGTNRFTYSFPQYTYHLYTQVLLDNISELKLYNSKTKETLSVPDYIITYKRDNPKAYHLPEQQIEFIQFLKTTQKTKSLEIKLPNLSYPIHDQMCGTVMMQFHPIPLMLR